MRFTALINDGQCGGENFVAATLDEAFEMAIAWAMTGDWKKREMVEVSVSGGGRTKAAPLVVGLNPRA